EDDGIASRDHGNCVIDDRGCGVRSGRNRADDSVGSRLSEVQSVIAGDRLWSKILRTRGLLGDELVFDDLVFIAAQARFLMRFPRQRAPMLPHGAANRGDDGVSLLQSHLVVLTEGYAASTDGFIEAGEHAEIIGGRGCRRMLSPGLGSAAKISDNTPRN